MHVRSLSNARTFVVQCTYVRCPMHVRSLSNARTFVVQCTYVRCPMHVRSLPNARKFVVQYTYVRFVMMVASFSRAVARDAGVEDMLYLGLGTNYQLLRSALPRRFGAFV